MVLGVAAAPAQTRIIGLAKNDMMASRGRPKASEAVVAFVYAPRIHFQSLRAFASPKAEIKGAVAINTRSMGKAMISLKTKGASADGAKADPAVMASLGAARPGGFPIMAGSDVVGAIAVSGSPSGGADEVCAKAAMAKIQDRIK